MERLLEMLPPRPRSVVARYAIATALVAVCALLAIGFEGTAAKLLGFIVLLPAIFAASIWLDRGCGIYASVLGTVLLYLVMRSDENVARSADFILPLAVFLLVTVGLAAVSEGLRTAWKRAAQAERAKDLLLRELGHRAKNNLAMVTSVLLLQARSQPDTEVRRALEQAVSRIQAIANAHEYLQPVADDNRVEMRSYLKRLCSQLGDSLRDVRPIAVTVTADEVYLRTQQAIPLGLIVNELVTNAFKHAFPDGRAGTVEVTLASGSPLTLTVADDGVGCPPTKEEHSGSRLMLLLAKQIKATITWENVERGCLVRVLVPNTEGT